MTRLIRAAAAVGFVALLAGPGRADDAAAVIDKAVKALGGEEKLGKATALSWAAKGTITIMDNDSEITTKATFQGLDHSRQEFEGDFGGNKVKGVTVLAGRQGLAEVRRHGRGDGRRPRSPPRSRRVYLAVVPVTVLPLKGKGFKVAAAAEEKVGDKPAAVLKATGPDGKDFTLFFDKETGLPVKQVAKVAGFGGEEVKQETTFGDYKEMDGIKKATKTESTRDGKKFPTASSPSSRCWTRWTRRRSPSRSSRRPLLPGDRP